MALDCTVQMIADPRDVLLLLKKVKELEAENTAVRAARDRFREETAEILATRTTRNQTREEASR